eukprot:1334925-Amorphochlora_amoeboformis.AAC.1
MGSPDLEVAVRMAGGEVKGASSRHPSSKGEVKSFLVKLEGVKIESAKEVKGDLCEGRYLHSEDASGTDFRDGMSQKRLSSSLCRPRSRNLAFRYREVHS